MTTEARLDAMLDDHSKAEAAFYEERSAECPKCKGEGRLVVNGTAYICTLCWSRGVVTPFEMTQFEEGAK